MSELYPVRDYFVYPSDDIPVRLWAENDSSIKLAPINRTNRTALQYANWMQTKIEMVKYDDYGLYPDNEDNMKVLFVRPDAYENTVEWYDQLAQIKKHRKTCAICCTPEQFREQFNETKFGWNYTVFYFDQYIKPGDQLAYFKMLIDCYGEENGINVLQQRLKIIHLDLMRMYGNFSAANDYHVDDELIKKALEGTQRLCYCRSLL